ncbi:MAG: HxsD-like protein [Myxococcales bacterium]|nr:HxsD-like protein [Myxococcales bacterium]
MATDLTISLHRAMYMAQAIRDAMGVFDDFATFSMEKKGDHYEVTIRDVDPEVDGDIVGEFSNFALAHTIERKRRTPK